MYRIAPITNNTMIHATLNLTCKKVVLVAALFKQIIEATMIFIVR
jgi:hypothetical protein